MKKPAKKASPKAASVRVKAAPGVATPGTGGRRASVSRATKETRISAAINLDGTGKYDIQTGIGFLDHMLEQLSRHSLIDITVRAEGDLHIDYHHTTEDSGIVLGECLAKALGDRAMKAHGALQDAMTGPFDEGLVRQRAADFSAVDADQAVAAAAAPPEVVEPEQVPTVGAKPEVPVMDVQHASGRGCDLWAREHPEQVEAAKRELLQQDGGDERNADAADDDQAHAPADPAMQEGHDRRGAGRH